MKGLIWRYASYKCLCSYLNRQEGDAEILHLQHKVVGVVVGGLMKGYLS